MILSVPLLLLTQAKIIPDVTAAASPTVLAPMIAATSVMTMANRLTSSVRTEEDKERARNNITTLPLRRCVSGRGSDGA